MSDWVGRWWSTISRSWLKVISASPVSVRVEDARGQFDLTPGEVEKKIESGQWTKQEQP